MQRCTDLNPPLLDASQESEEIHSRNQTNQQALKLAYCDSSWTLFFCLMRHIKTTMWLGKTSYFSASCNFTLPAQMHDKVGPFRDTV